jgi:hypothetical protein
VSVNGVRDGHVPGIDQEDRAILEHSSRFVRIGLDSAMRGHSTDVERSKVVALDEASLFKYVQ